MAVGSFLVLGVMAATAGSAWGQQPRGAYEDVKEMPSGVAGARIRELLETVNANDPA
jgi:hypothetical protein